MKTACFRFSLLLIATVALTCLAPAAGPKKPAAPTLAEIVSNPAHLEQALGPKTLLLTRPVAGAINPELAAVIKEAKLDQKTQFFILPLEASEPKARVRAGPIYPYNLRRAGVSGKASFLVLIGADGKIKGIYCYAATQPAFASAAAEAILKWQFEPAKIQGTAVPVLVSQILEFTAD